MLVKDPNKPSLATLKGVHISKYTAVSRSFRISFEFLSHFQ